MRRAIYANCTRLITVNLAPADLRKEGPAYDLPIAVGLLLASEQLHADLSRALIIGELSLDCSVRHTNGVLPMAALAREKGFNTLFVPASDAPEAALIPGLDVYPIETLFALVMHLQAMQSIAPYRPAHDFTPETTPNKRVIPDTSSCAGRKPHPSLADYLLRFIRTNWRAMFFLLDNPLDTA